MTDHNLIFSNILRLKANCQLRCTQMVYDDEMDTILLIRSLWFNLTWVASPTSFCMHKGTHIFIHFPFLFRSLECVEDNNLIVFSKAKLQAYRPRSKYQKRALYNNLFIFYLDETFIVIKKRFSVSTISHN